MNKKSNVPGNEPTHGGSKLIAGTLKLKDEERRCGDCDPSRQSVDAGVRRAESPPRQISLSRRRLTASPQ